MEINKKVAEKCSSLKENSKNGWSIIITQNAYESNQFFPLSLFNFFSFLCHLIHAQIE